MTIGTQSKGTISRSTPSTASTSSSSSRTTSTSSSAPPEKWDSDIQSYPVPAGLRGVSPDGTGYASWTDGEVCLYTWDGASVGCPLAVPEAGVASLGAQYSASGAYVAVLVAGADGKTTVYMIDTATLEPTVLTAAGMVPLDGATPLTLNLAAVAWDNQQRDLYLLQVPDAGAAEADLMIASNDGVEPTVVPVPAEIASSYPQMLAIDSKVLFAPTTGPQLGTLWQITSDLKATQIGDSPLNPSGPATLITLSPDGDYAMYCDGSGGGLGQLREINLDTADSYQYLKEDEGCLGAAYSTDGDYIAVVGPIDEDQVLTVLSVDNDDVPLNEVLDGSVQEAPTHLIWGTSDVITVIEADNSDPAAKINVLVIDR